MGYYNVNQGLYKVQRKLQSTLLNQSSRYVYDRTGNVVYWGFISLSLAVCSVGSSTSGRPSPVRPNIVMKGAVRDLLWEGKCPC